MTLSANENQMLATDGLQLVTMMVNGQLVGVPINHVHDVFVVQKITRVPRATDSMVGLVNLRGRVVSLLSLRVLLGFPAIDVTTGVMAVGIEWHGDSFGLVVDQICEVMMVDTNLRDEHAGRVDGRWAGLAKGIHRLADGLLIELDVAALLAGPLKTAA